MPKLIPLPIVCAAVLAAAVVACTSTSDESAPAPSLSPTAATQESPTSELPGGAGGDLPETVVPPTQEPSLPPVPTGWATYEDAEMSDFSFRYPSDWHSPETGRIHSWGPASPYYPPGGILLDFSRTPIPADADPKELDPPAGSSKTRLGGVDAWEIVQTRDAGPGEWNRSHQVWTDVDGYRYWLGAAFTEKDADETTFQQIVSSFNFTK